MAKSLDCCQIWCLIETHQRHPAKNQIGFVLHCIDHRPFEAWIFCPLLYHQLLMKTFSGPDHLHSTTCSTCRPSRFLLRPSTDHLAQTLPLGFSNQVLSSSQRVHPSQTQKRFFTTARSIVAYHATIAAPILATTSWLLIDISKQVFSKAFGDRTVYQIWKQIHSAMDAPFQFQSHNDDLVGFFTSLPQQRILEDVQDMIQRYCRSNRLDIATAVMSVPSRTHKYHQPSIQGKVSFADQPNGQNTTKTCAWHCQNELWSWHFPRGWTFLSVRLMAQPLGNQISPSTFRYIGVQNWTWLGLPTPNRNSCTLRWQSVYIGACAHFDRTRFAPRFSTIMWQRFFYIPPVELEPVKDPEEFLGFKISLSARRISFILPLEKWQHRHPRSAGSPQNKLSAFNARAALIRAHGYPKTQIDQDLQALVKLFPESRGVPVTSSTRWKVSLDRPCSGVKFCP